MRTTLTLDDDVVLTVKEEMKSGDGMSFKTAVNSLIRRARFVKNDARQIGEFRLKGRALRSREHVNFDCISKLIEELDNLPIR
jgi:hypothetical protein